MAVWHSSAVLVWPGFVLTKPTTHLMWATPPSIYTAFVRLCLTIWCDDQGELSILAPHTHGFYGANQWWLSTPSPLVSDLCLRLLGTLERHNKAIRCGLWNGYDASLICVIQVNSILYRQLWGPLASICILMTMLRLLRFHTTLDTRIMNGKRNGAVSGFYLLFCIIVSRPFLK